MGYGCPPPLAGGGVAPGDADTRVITALLAAAALGGGGAKRCVERRGEEVGGCWWGGGGGVHIHTCTSLHPSIHTVLPYGESWRPISVDGLISIDFVQLQCWTVSRVNSIATAL